MAEECPKEKANAVAYELIYKAPDPAAKSPLPSSPQSERPLSREFIDQKLKEAADRREAVLKENEERLAKERLHREEVLEKAAKDEEELKRRTKEHIEKKLEASEERREAFYKDVKRKLAEYISRVDAARRKNDEYVEALRQRIEQNLDKKSEKRDQILANIKEKLQEHDVHVEEVNKMVAAKEKETAESTFESTMEKMTNAFKKKEKQLSDLLSKLAEHDKHREEVRQKSAGGGDAPMES